MSTLKDHVKGTVSFLSLADGALWYVTDDGFEFPVPLEDTKGAVFLNKDRALLFMRWIRKHMEMIEQAHKEQ